MRHLTKFIALSSLFAMTVYASAAPPRHMPLRTLPNRPQPAPVAPFNAHVNSPFLTPNFTSANQFSPFFHFAPQQRFLREFQFNHAMFNTRFGFPSAFQNQTFQQRRFLLQQQRLGTFNPFLTQTAFNNFRFNPFLGSNQFGAFSPFLNSSSSFSPFVNTGSFASPGFSAPFAFPSAGVSLGGF
jgi:hypothetical protein